MSEIYNNDTITRHRFQLRKLAKVYNERPSPILVACIIAIYTFSGGHIRWSPYSVATCLALWSGWTDRPILLPTIKRTNDRGGRTAWKHDAFNNTVERRRHCDKCSIKIPPTSFVTLVKSKILFITYQRVIRTKQISIRQQNFQLNKSLKQIPREKTNN